MIDVRLYAHLAPAAAGAARRSSGAAAAAAEPDVIGAAAGTAGAAEFQVEARPGLTVQDVVTEAGIRPEDVYIIMRNGVRVELDAPLTHGDRLGLFPAVSGG